MTPAPEQDVAALVAWLREAADEEVSATYAAKLRDAAAKFSTVADGRDEARRLVNQLSEDITFLRKRRGDLVRDKDDAEARAATLEAERDESVKAHDRAEIGWASEREDRIAIEAQLARAREDAAQVALNCRLWQGSQDLLDTQTKEHIAAAIRSLPAPADGRGDQMAEESHFGGPPNGYHPLPSGVVCKCFKLWRDNKGNHWCCLPIVTDATPIDPPTEPGADADDIRAQGWAVAVHNDYRLNGESHTFWLFTKGSACVKGEGRTDAEALDAIRSALTVPPSTAQTGDA